MLLLTFLIAFSAIVAVGAILTNFFNTKDLDHKYKTYKALEASKDTISQAFPFDELNNNRKSEEIVKELTTVDSDIQNSIMIARRSLTIAIASLVFSTILSLIQVVISLIALKR